MAHEAGEGEADVLMAGARGSFEAATMLLRQIDSWRGKHGWVKLS
jgi:hypothetical protein